jgi:hypothetical protein
MESFMHLNVFGILSRFNMPELVISKFHQRFLIASVLLVTILVALLVVLSIVLNIPLTVLGIRQLLISIHQFSFFEVYQEYCNSGGNSHEKDDNFFGTMAEVKARL